MTKSETIPAAILAQARAVYERLGCGSVADEATIARAIFTERKRCALIAEGHFDNDGTGPDCQGCGEFIASSIRGTP